MTKSATREAADKVTFTQTEVTSAVALKAPIATPSFTGGIDVTGTVVSDGLTVDGRVAVFDTTQTMNGGISTEVNAGILNFGLNEGSANRFGGSYTQANQGGMLNFDTRAGQPLFQIYTRAAGVAAATGTASFNIESSGQVQIGSPSASAGWLLNLKALSGGSTVRLQSNNGYDAISFLNASGSQCGWIRSNASSVAYNSSSDYRLKTDVQPMTGATDRVKLLKPCNFEWIVDGTRVDGFLAHEAQEVVPESVTGTKDAMMDEEYEVTPAVVDDEGNETTAAVMGTRSVPDLQGIDQAKLVPLLTATIQELIARIEALEGE